MKERITYLDTAKGILIILMLMGHIWTSGAVRDFIYTFHIPAFFVIAGFLFNYSSSINYPFYKSVIAKIKTLLVPYLFFEIFAILMRIFEEGRTTLNLKGYAFEILNLHLFNGPLWFLIVMFISELLFLLLQKIKNKKIHYGIIIILFVAILILPKYDNYISITTIVSALFFIQCGYFGRTIITGNSTRITALAFAVTLIISIINVCGGMPEYQDGNALLYVVGAISGSYFIIQISKKTLCKPFEFYGKNSLIVLGTHYPILRLIKARFLIAEFSFFNGLIVLLAILAIEVPLIYSINKFLPFIIGKWYTHNGIKAKT